MVKGVRVSEVVCLFDIPDGEQVTSLHGIDENDPSFTDVTEERGASS